MKKRSFSAILSVLLVAVMLLSLIPLAVSAETTTTATKITGIDALVSGQYVIVANGGKMMTTFDAKNGSSSWVLAEDVTVGSDGKISNVEYYMTWTVTVSGTGASKKVKLTSSNGYTIMPYSETDGKIKSDSDNAYEWTVSVVEDTEDTFVFGGKDGSVSLAGNSSSSGKFRAYKNDTINNNLNGYPSKFNLYKTATTLTAPESSDDQEPTYVSISEARAAASGSTVYTEGTIIFIDGKNVVIYDGTAGINVYLTDADDTLAVGDKVKAKGTRSAYSGLEQLASASIEQKVSSNNSIAYASTTIADILADTTGAMESKPVKLSNVKISDITTTTNNNSTITTITVTDGTKSIQIYKAPTLSGIDAGDTININKAVVGDHNGYQLRVANASDIEFVSDGAVAPVEYVSITEALAATDNDIVYTEGVIIFIDGRNVVIYDGTAGINVYLPAADDTLAVGDKVKVKGTRGDHRGLEQLGSAEIVEEVSSGNAITYNASTIAAILADTTGAIESTPVKLENVTIGEINTSGNTSITDANGNTINIYKIPALTGIDEGDTVTVSVIVSDYNGYQLRVVAAADIELVSKGTSGSGNAGGGSVQTGDATAIIALSAALATLALAGVYFAKKRTLAE